MHLEDFDFIEPPDHRLVNDGRKLLIELGAMTEKVSPLKFSQMAAHAKSPNPFIKGGFKAGLNQNWSANGKNAD